MKTSNKILTGGLIALLIGIIVLLFAVRENLDKIEDGFSQEKETMQKLEKLEQLEKESGE